MTTKKQRREQVAAKRAAYDAESKRLGLEAQRISREQQERQKHDAERAEKSKRAALKIRKQHEAAEAKKKEQEAFNAYLDGIDSLAEELQARSYEEAIGLRQSVEVGAEEKY